jgi:Na+/H+-dicarboxylate symporter
MKNFILTFKLPIALILILCGSFLFGQSVPLVYKQGLYALSLLIKDTLVFVLPLIIFSFIFGSLSHLKDRALTFVLFIVPAICLSNLVSTLLAYATGISGLSVMGKLATLTSNTQALEPLFQLEFPKIASNDVALLAGLVMGIALLYLKPSLHRTVAPRLMGVSFFILKKLFIPLIPLFILGFGLKLEADDSLEIIITQYPRILALIALAVLLYIVFLYCAGKGFKKRGFDAIKNMMPAVVTGFSSMSSAAAMPLTILATEKNLDDPEMSKIIIPSTVNVHLMGDCFAIPIFALCILVTFGHPLPSFETYLIFSLFFVLAKFAVAAVPGGGILVMIPILEKYLGFDSTMISLITALYIMFDPVITSLNILGNGAFAIGFQKIFSKATRKTSDGKSAS